MISMRALRLVDNVAYHGKDFFGRESHLILKPRPRNSWTWVDYNMEPVRISPEILKSNKRRVQLVFGNKILNVFEHIGVLRHVGLVGVEVCGVGWPPYDGSAHELWNLVEPCIKETTEQLRLYTVEKSVRFQSPILRRGRKVFTEIHPSLDGRTTLDIFVDFKGLGEHREVFSLPNRELFKEICSARSLGFPSWLYYPTKMASLVGYPHFKNVCWSKSSSKEETLREIVRHRALDILGAMSVLSEEGLFVGNIVSSCSGHAEDVGAIDLAIPLVHLL